MIFVGDDWAEDHHDMHLMDADGDAAGVAAATRRPGRHRGVARVGGRPCRRPSQVVIGIETDRGLWVQALECGRLSGVRGQPAGGGPLPRPPPGFRGEIRCRRCQTAGRSGAHRPAQPPPIAGDSPDAEAIKVLARGHQNLIWARTRHTNMLRSALREYYPAALEAFDDLADRDALAVLGRAPTPAEAHALSLSKIRSALKHAGRQRNIDARARRDPDGAAHRATRRPRSGHRRVRRDHPCRGRHHRRTEPPDQPILRPNWRHILRHTRTPTSTSPCQDSVSSSAPGCSVSSGTTRTDTPPPSLAKTTPEPHH